MVKKQKGHFSVVTVLCDKELTFIPLNSKDQCHLAKG